MARKAIQLPTDKRDPLSAAAVNARSQAVEALNRKLTSLVAKLIGERFELEELVLTMQQELLELRQLKAEQAEQQLVSADA
jgi:hypothetical protein